MVGKTSLGKRLVWLGAIVCTLSGCQTVPTRNDANKPPPAPDTVVSRVVVLWSEAVLRQAQTPVAQGFAAKVYLFGPETESPVTAAGKFTIYAYDETGRGTDQTKDAAIKPDFAWELSESELRPLLKKDAIGWSYSMWLPCVQPEPGERRYTLIVSFSPTNGPQVLSDSTLVTLPGIRNTPTKTLSQTPSEPATDVTSSPALLAHTLGTTP